MSDGSAPVILCAAEALADGQSKGFEVGEGRTAIEGFLVRRGKRIYAYENICPHTGVPLDWVDDQFLTREKDYIMCATHGALFRIETGECLAGPCQGDWLRALPVEVDGGNIVLKL